MEELKNHVLTDQEWRIVAGLREVPLGRPREQLLAFLAELTDFVREPRCSQVQADGVPCGAVQADCEECLHVEEMLRSLREGMQPRF